MTGAWLFLCFATAYFMSFALRSIGAVIAPELTRDFGLSHAQLGSLTSAYFFAFAMMQLPLGVWLDRFGARRTHGSLLLVAAAGCALFASAADVAWLWAGRALIGIGVAGGLMAALKAFRFWFAPHRQQQLAAWMLVAGSLGALTTTVPVRWLLPVAGWRGVFWLAAGLLVVAAMMVLWGLPRDEERSSQAQSAGNTLWGGYREVFASGYFWRFIIIAMLCHASFVALQTLWAGPWLMRVLGQEPAQAAQSLFVFNLVLMGGYLGLSALIPRINRRWTMSRIVVAGMLGVLTVEGLIALADGAWAWMLWPLLALASTFFTMVQPHVSLSFPAALTGRAYTGYNLLLFSAMFMAQWVFGIGVDAFEHGGLSTPAAFRATLSTMIAVQLAGLAVFCLWRPAPPQQRPA